MRDEPRVVPVGCGCGPGGVVGVVRGLRRWRMSGKVLRRAAVSLREQWADEDGAPRPMGTAWHWERDFHLAVAHLLDERAREFDRWSRAGNGQARMVPDEFTAAFAVARAYLNDQ